MDQNNIPKLRLSIREKRLFQALHKKDYSKDEMEQILKGLNPDICSTQFYMAFAHLCAMHDWKYVPENIKQRARRVQQYHRTRSALLLPTLVKVAKILSEHDIKTMILSDIAMNVFYAKQMPTVSIKIDICTEPGKTIAAYQLLKKEFNLKYLLPEGAAFIANGSPVVLHWGFSMNGISDEEGVWERTKTTMLDGIELYAPSAEDMLIREAVEEYKKIFVLHEDNRELRFAVYADAIIENGIGNLNCHQEIDVMLEGYQDALSKIPSGDMSFVIEKVYTQNFRGKQRMCTEVRRGGSSADLWIEADENLGKIFADDRSDFAVLALINQAVRREADIVSEVPITTELKETLEMRVIPALMLRWNHKDAIKLKIPTVENDRNVNNESCKRRSAILSGITLDDVWTMEEYCGEKKTYRHQVDEILTINAGGYNTAVNSTVDKKSKEAAQRYSLTSVKVDTNLEVLNDCERFDDVRFLRIAACMYGMACRYEEITVSEQLPANRVLHQMNELSYLDYYLASSLSGSHMRFRTAGAGTTRSEKIADLISKNIEWSSACEKEGKLCGHCSSCHADIAILFIMGKDNWINKCYNEKDLRRNLDFHLAYCMTEKKYNDIPKLMKQKGIPFSNKCIEMAKHLNAAQERMKNETPPVLAKRIHDVKY